MNHTLMWISLICNALCLATVLLMAPRVKRWWRRVRRRKGGVYLVRVDHHRNPARRINGYVGETWNHHFRRLDHLGQGRNGQVAQSWSDLRPVWYQIPVPWWLCFKPVLRALETMLMLLTWPVYNDAKNRWNPRRITKSQARLDRARRELDRAAARIPRARTAHK